MSKAADPVLDPLVAEGAAIRAKIEAKQKEREKAFEPVAAIDAELKAFAAELEAVNLQLIGKGLGPYCAEDGTRATVVAGSPAVRQPDTFHLPDGMLDKARDLSGEHFRKLFDRTEVFTPRNGFDAIADVLLTPAKARNLVALCIIPGEIKGGRKESVRWK